MRKLLFIAFSLIVHSAAKAEDGDVIYSTSNGVMLEYHVVSEAEKTVAVVGAPERIDIYNPSKDEYGTQEQNLDKVTSISVPAEVNGYRVVATEERAFSSYGYSCDNLKSVFLPEGMERLGERTLCNQEKLEEVYLPTTLAVIENHCFENCTSLEQITLPVNLKAKDEYSYEGFYGCMKLKTLNVLCKDAKWLLNVVTVTYRDVITGEESSDNLNTIVENIHFGKDVELLKDEYYAPGVFPNLKTITVDPANPTYDSRDKCNAVISRADNTLVYGCVNTIIPHTVKAIGNGAFLRRTALTHITIPESVEVIAGYAFAETGLKTIEIPKHVKEIRNDAFNGCTELEHFYMYTDECRLYDNVFAECHSLKAIDFPAHTIVSEGWANGTSIERLSFGVGCYVKGLPGETLKSLAFADCPWHLDNSIYDDGQPVIVQDDPYTIDTWIPLSVSLDNISFGEGGVIGGLSDREELKTFVVPDGCTLSGGCFGGCHNLRKVTFPKGTSYLEHDLFYDCTSLKEIDIPESCHGIGDRCFAGCTSLERITIPKWVQSLGEGMIDGCTNLKEIVSYLPEPINAQQCLYTKVEYRYDPEEGFVYNITYPETLYVPAGTKANYLEVGDWCKIKNIIEMGGTAVSTQTYQVTSNNQITYNLNGQRTGANSKGINIVRMPDGTVRKVLNR